jgi:AcrR family transcriptional regulator
VATSLEDITHAAGVSKGLFYLYFASKDDLVLALREQFSRQFAERIRIAAAIPADWPARLDACVQASFDCYRDLHDLHEVLFHWAGHAGPAHDRRHEPTHALVTQVIGEPPAAPRDDHRDAPGEIAEQSRKSTWHAHSWRQGSPIITNLLPNTG